MSAAADTVLSPAPGDTRGRGGADPAPTILPRTYYQCLDPDAAFIGDLVEVTLVTPERVTFKVLSEGWRDWATSTSTERFRTNFILAGKPADCHTCED